MMRLCRRQQERGQTIVYLALLVGVLMVIAALVIDVGSTHRVRAQTKYAADAASLAGLASWIDTPTHDDPTAARARALDVLAKDGYQLGVAGVTDIVAFAYDHTTFNWDTGSPKDVPGSDRYYVKISRELPQYIANVIGIGRTGVTQRSVAATVNEVPIDIQDLGNIGFPNHANISEFGPDAPYTFGDRYSTKFINGGVQDKQILGPNPDYKPDGYTYDIWLPDDLPSPWVRIELFDPDTINAGTNSGGVNYQPSKLGPDPDPADPCPPTEPQYGAIDEIRLPPPDGLDLPRPTPAQFPDVSTQTQWDLYTPGGDLVASATYGPLSNTPFWYQNEAPATDPVHTLPAGPMAQIATDLKWITPVGFEFDTTTHGLQYKLQVHTTHGSSENGFGMRIGVQRASGVTYCAKVHGVSPSGMPMQMYARGILPINLPSDATTTIPIGDIPAEADTITVTNFDTDIYSQYIRVTMDSVDTTAGGQGLYPILFPADIVPPGKGLDAVYDDNNNKYYQAVKGTLAPNGQVRTDIWQVPQNVVVPETAGPNSTDLVLSGGNKIIIKDTRPYEGGNINITYAAGHYDTSVWEVKYSGTGHGTPGQIVLIR